MSASAAASGAIRRGAASAWVQILGLLLPFVSLPQGLVREKVVPFVIVEEKNHHRSRSPTIVYRSAKRTPPWPNCRTTPSASVLARLPPKTSVGSRRAL